MPFQLRTGAVGGPTTTRGQQLIQRARQLADQSATLGARRLGLRSVQQATPISVARPGESPYRRRAVASVAATGLGVPQDLFLEEAMRLTPRGIPQYTTLRRRF